MNVLAGWRDDGGLAMMGIANEGGIGLDYLAYIRQPGWKPIPAFNKGNGAGDLLLPRPVKGKYKGNGSQRGGCGPHKCKTPLASLPRS